MQRLDCDLITVWPTNCDYPLFRRQLKENRKRFDKVLISFMNPYDRHDYSTFVKNSLLGNSVFFKDPIKIKGDWRDESIKSVLIYSTAKWVLFIEQDFFFKKGFWNRVHELMDKHSVVGVMQGVRLHPCFLMIKREVLEKTKKDFSANAKHDHFGQIQKDLSEYNIGVVEGKYYTHMNGLSHNFRLMASGQEVVYKPIEFSEYLRKSLHCGEPIDPEYKEICERYLYGA